MTAHIAALLLAALLLSGCEPVVVVPAWYAPHVDHTLQCDDGECNIGTSGSKGPM